MKTKDLFMYALGALIVVTILVIVAFLIFRPMPKDNESLLQLVVGTLIAAFTQVVSYFFGTSKSSADKNEMLYNSTPVSPQPLPQPEPPAPPAPPQPAPVEKELPDITEQPAQ
jgi:hypothetical protein